MALPAIKVSVAFTLGALDGGVTFTDITDYVSSVTFGRGRANEFSDTEAGTATIVLDNSDGRFTPRNGASPYFPGVVPGKRIKIEADFGGGAGYEVLGRYFAADWVVNFPDGNDLSTVTLTANDGFSILALQELESPWICELRYDYSQTTGNEFNTQTYWGLSEPSGGSIAETVVVDSLLANAVRGAGIKAGKSTAGASYALGYAPIIPGDQGTCLRLNANGNSGYCLDLSYYAAQTGTYRQSWVFPIQIPVGATGNVFTMYYANGKQMLAMQPDRTFFYNDDGSLLATYFYGDDNGAIPGTLATGTTRVVGVSYNSGTVTVNMDDGSANPHSQIVSNLYNVGSVQIGGVSNKWGSGSFLTCTIGAVGWFNSTTPPGQVDASVAKTGAAGDTEQTRFIRLTDWVKYPEPDTFQTARQTSSRMQALSWASGTPALELIKAFSASVGGEFFVNKAGFLVHANRASRWNQTAINLGTCVTDGDLEFHWDYEVYNSVEATQDNGGVQLAQDSSSINKYGRRTLSFSSGVQDAEEVRNAAGFMLYWRKNPLVRISALSFDATTISNATDMAKLLRLDFLDRAVITGLPSKSPTTGQLDFFVEKITHTIAQAGGATTWRVDLEISPATFATNTFRLDDATSGQLGGYATLTAAMNNSATTITVSAGATWPATPFAAKVEDEPVTVTNVSGTTLTVTRTTPLGHDVGAEVIVANAGFLSY